MRLRDADPLDIVLITFGQLEEQLQSCMAYIPFVSQNEAVVSPKFVPIMLESCTLIESIFRRMVNGRERVNFKAYSNLIEPDLNLADATTLLLGSPLQFLRPFQNWTGTPPVWWNAYNEAKHDRIGRYRSATFSCTVNALAGLHQVISRSRLFVDLLGKAGWVDAAHPHLSDLMLCTTVGCWPPEMPTETRLFVSPIRGEFADWTTEPPEISSEWEFSWRVKFHVWDYQDRRGLAR